VPKDCSFSQSEEEESPEPEEEESPEPEEEESPEPEEEELPEPEKESISKPFTTGVKPPKGSRTVAVIRGEFAVSTESTRKMQMPCICPEKSHEVVWQCLVEPATTTITMSSCSRWLAVRKNPGTV
jgi:outer membrane biosynthesis protein TonB